MDGIALMREDMLRDDERNDDGAFFPKHEYVDEESQKRWRTWFNKSHEEAMKVPLWDDKWSKK